MGARRPRKYDSYTETFTRVARIVGALVLSLALTNAPAHAATEPVEELRNPGWVPVVVAVALFDDSIYAKTYSDALPRGDAWLRIDTDLRVVVLDDEDPVIDQVRKLAEQSPQCLPDDPDVCFRALENRWRVESTQDGGETWAPDLSITARQYKRLVTAIYGWYASGPSVRGVATGTWGGEPVVVAAGGESGLIVKHLGSDDAAAGPDAWVRYTSFDFAHGAVLVAMPTPDNSPFEASDLRRVWLATLLVGSVLVSLIVGAANVVAGSDQAHNPRRRTGVVLGSVAGVLGVVLVAWTAQDHEDFALTYSSVEAANNGFVSPPHWPFAVFLGGPVLIAIAYVAVAALGWHAGKGLMHRVVLPVLITGGSGLAALGVVWLADAIGLTHAADRVMDWWWALTLVLATATAWVVLRIMGSRTVDPISAPAPETTSV